MIEQYRAALPEAELVVFDNNSTDGTGEIARGLGFASSTFRSRARDTSCGLLSPRLKDFDVVVLTDGDGTYPAEAAPLLIGPLLVDAADMAVGARRPAPGTGAMSLTRGLGKPADSGSVPDLDRAGHHRFAFRLSHVSTGGFAKPFGFARVASRSRPSLRARRWRGAFVSLRLQFRITLRIAGTQSKLRAFRDGRRILVMILLQSLRLRPHRPVLAWLVPCALLAICVHRGFAAVAGLGVMVLWGLFLLISGLAD